MPGNPAQVTTSSQKTLKACGLLETFCSILMASGVPADILTETINTVAEVIRGNQGNQEYFASVMAPSHPPRCVTRRTENWCSVCRCTNWGFEPMEIKVQFGE
jgi:hypothetical protein